MLNSPRQRTITTVGLPARKEQLIKSMLLAVRAQTVDAWSFSDDVEADVAICEVDSALATVTAVRARQAGRPQCVWLAAPDTTAPDGRRLDDPIGSSSLIAILDDVSTQLDGPAPQAAATAAAPAVGASPAPTAPVVVGPPPAITPTPSPAAAAAAPMRGPAFDLALTLRELLQQNSVDTVQVSRGDVEIRLVPATKHLRMSHAPGDAIFTGLVDGTEALRVTRLPDPEAIRALPHAPAHIEVLWRLGLAAGGEVLLPPFTSEHILALTRWPDFGRLTHQPMHVQLAARLVRRPHTVDELAAAARVPVGEVRRFVNAAALVGLVETRPTPASAPPPPQDATPPPARPRGLFRSIRAALGFGGQS